MSMLKEWDKIRKMVLKDLQLRGEDFPLQCIDPGEEMDVDEWLDCKLNGISHPVDLPTEENRTKVHRWRVSWQTSEWSGIESKLFSSFAEAVDFFNEVYYCSFTASFRKEVY